MLNFKINQKDIDKIGNFSSLEKDFRLKNLLSFNKIGFPNKKDEDWKFSDLSEIITKNFTNLNLKFDLPKKQNIDFIKEFEHNYIIITNGELTKSNFKFEDSSKIKIEQFSDLKILDNNKENNSLAFLNNALSKKGYSLNVKKDYKFKKIIVIYNIFTADLNENILNSKNFINIEESSEAHILEIDINKSNKNFFNNVSEYISLGNNSLLKSIYLQSDKSNGYFHKRLKSNLSTNSKYSSFIFPTGSKFNKMDLEFDLLGEHSECTIKGASLINKYEHQEIKTKINHLAPKCKSFQKIKNVIDGLGKGVYQGKIFVKNIAQKTDAYQLSKAILLNENSEFDSKPELEIYADDVKCSHGSTSGNIDDDSVYYLMSRGLSKKDSIKMLVNGFLNEITNDIKNISIKEFIQKKQEI